MRSKLCLRRRRRRSKDSSSGGEGETRMHSKYGDEVLPTVNDKRNQITDTDTITSGMVGKETSENVIFRDVEKVGGKTKTGKKTLGSLLLEKIRQRPDYSMKRPLKEKFQLVKTEEVTKAPLRKRIELIKRNKVDDEDVVKVKKESCGTNG